MSVFALSCVGLLLFLWVSFGGTLPLRAQGYRVAVLLPDSGDVTPQTDVRIAGVSVGKVVGVALDRSNTRAVLELNRRYAPLHGNIHVFVRRKSLLGEVYLELTPGMRSAPALLDGATIPASHVTTTTSLDQILSAFDPTTLASLQAWLGGWAQSVNGRGPAISDDVARFAGTARAAAPAEIPSELLALATHRQPYSRPNAYMSPGVGLISTGRLQAFDCRQLANALTVPAIPGGQPDCLQQAPWTFEGQTRQTPQLQPKP
jgi:hypothetical protein